MRHSVAPFALSAAASDGDILLQPRRRACCTSVMAAIQEWREEWRSGKASDDNPLWRVDVDSARDTHVGHHAVRYLGALVLHAVPFCAYVLLFGALGPTYESAGIYAATKAASLVLQLLGFLENTNFSLRNLPWMLAPGSILYSLVWVLDAFVAFSSGATGQEAQQRSEHGVGVSAWLAAVNAWAQVVAFIGDALWITHTRVGWWCWCCCTGTAVSPTHSHRPLPRSLVVRTLVFVFSVGVIAVFGLQFVKYDELVLRPLAAERPDVPWLRPLCCIAMRQLVGFAISLRIALYPIRSSKEQWLRVRGVVMAPFLLASVAGCASWVELMLLVLQDGLLFSLRVTGFLHLQLHANPLRVSQQALRILAGRKWAFDVRTARVDAVREPHATLAAAGTHTHPGVTLSLTFYMTIIANASSVRACNRRSFSQSWPRRSPLPAWLSGAWLARRPSSSCRARSHRCLPTTCRWARRACIAGYWGSKASVCSILSLSLPCLLLTACPLFELSAVPKGSSSESSRSSSACRTSPWPRSSLAPPRSSPTRRRRSSSVPTRRSPSEPVRSS